MFPRHHLRCRHYHCSRASLRRPYIDPCRGPLYAHFIEFPLFVPPRRRRLIVVRVKEECVHACVCVRVWDIRLYRRYVKCEFSNSEHLVSVFEKNIFIHNSKSLLGSTYYKCLHHFDKTNYVIILSFMVIIFKFYIYFFNGYLFVIIFSFSEVDCFPFDVYNLNIKRVVRYYSLYFKFRLAK